MSIYVCVYIYALHASVWAGMRTSLNAHEFLQIVCENCWKWKNKNESFSSHSSHNFQRHAKISQVGAQKKVSFIVSRQCQLLAATSLDNKSFIVIVLYLKAKKWKCLLYLLHQSEIRLATQNNLIWQHHVRIFFCFSWIQLHWYLYHKMTKVICHDTQDHLTFYINNMSWLWNFHDSKFWELHFLTRSLYYVTTSPFWSVFNI